MKLRALILALVGVVASLNSIEAGASESSAFSGRRQTLMHDGVERSFVVRAPAVPMDGTEKVPLVLVLHGGGGNANNAEKWTGFTQKARKEGFIAVYPEGTRRKGRLLRILTWNAGHCCGPAMRNRVDDVGFIDALLEVLIETYPVDPKRIYVTGGSNGGMMSHTLGIELSHRFAAIAPVIATVFGDERQPEHPVSAIMLNGMLDKSVPYEGGPPGGRFPDAWDETPARPAKDQAAFWAEANGCADTPDTHDKGQYVLLRYRCPAGRAVALYGIKDNGHAWPGGRRAGLRGDIPSQSLNGTDVIWDFFKAHSK
jgi:polyhydroxybutyrate depolymerase